MKTCPNCRTKLDLNHLVNICPNCGFCLVDEEGYGGLVLSAT